MGTTRRRRPQRGGGRLGLLLVGALAASSGTAAEDPSVREAVTAWWTGPPSYQAAQTVVKAMRAAVPSFSLPSLSLFASGDDGSLLPKEKEALAPAVDPYLVDAAEVGQRQAEVVAAPEGMRFLQGKDVTVLGQEYDDGDGPMLDVRVTIDGNEEVYAVPTSALKLSGGRRRKQRRKTLRRKK